MNDCKASAQNFDSSYIYKVEEREESEQIVCHSDRGLLSIENNELPKVTRYFLKNNKGEPQGYIERKLILNVNADIKEDDGELIPQNYKSDKVVQQPAPASHKENTKVKHASHAALNARKKTNSFVRSSKRFYQSHERCDPLNSTVFDRRRNYTLDFTSSNSTPSERTFNIIHPASTADLDTERNAERQTTNEKIFSKRTQRIFCNDPNQRLKNLFTIVKPNEQFNEKLTGLNAYDIDLLNKTKDLLVKRIDEELQRIQPETQPDDTKNVKFYDGSAIDKRVLKKLRLECIRKIEDELKLMKRLQN